jgi:hypothetical protein
MGDDQADNDAAGTVSMRRCAARPTLVSGRVKTLLLRRVDGHPRAADLRNLTVTYLPDLIPRRWLITDARDPVGDPGGTSRSSFDARELRRSRLQKGGTMSLMRTAMTALAAAALLMLGACVSPDDVSSLESRVAALENKANAADARASELEAAANQCTATCQDVEARAERMLQQSMIK